MRAESSSSWFTEQNKLAADLSDRETGFHPKFVYVWLSMHEVALG
jgi:hypothetical protein